MKPHLYLTFLVFSAILFFGCKKEPLDNWVETHDVAISVDKSNPENGKQYLQVIYENIGNDAYRKIKYQLITRTGTKFDTTEKTIFPETIVHPKDKHLVPPPIGQTPATFDEAHVGKIWVVKDEK